ncbi:hypothetical protein D3C75_747560 [compost metagenome]
MAAQVAAEIRVAALRAVNEGQGFLEAERCHNRAERLARLMRINDNRFTVKVLLHILGRLGVSERFCGFLLTARRFELLLVQPLLHEPVFREQCVVIRNVQSVLTHMLASSFWTVSFFLIRFHTGLFTVISMSLAKILNPSKPW